MDDHAILLPSQLLALNKSQPSNQNRQSFRRERPRRSSPLAGPSYSADGGGNLVEQASALQEEILRRRLENDLPTPPISRQVSVDSPRRARPSFISLAPSRDSLIPPSPPLRERHSSPDIVIHPDLSRSSSSLPAGTDWMSAPSPAFSHPTPYVLDGLLPTGAPNDSGKRVRHKSLPSISKPGPTPKNKSDSVRSRSLKRFRSVGRLFKHDRDEAGDVPPVPPGLFDPGSDTWLGEDSVTPPATPKEAKPDGSVSEGDKDRGRVRKLWARVLGGVKRSRA